jgi:hypothetical protein
MKHFCMMLILGLIAAACKKETKTQLPSTSVQLLTEKSWTITGHGFDNNQNGQLDTSENLIQNCESDNTYIFAINGTGSYRDNLLSCGSETGGDFSWKLLNENQILEIDFERLIVLKLSSVEMSLQANTTGFIVPYITTYTH